MNPSSLHKDWSAKDTKPSKFTRARKATFTQVCLLFFLWQHQSSSASQKQHSSMRTEETRGELSGKVMLPTSGEVWRELFPKQCLRSLIMSKMPSAKQEALSCQLCWDGGNELTEKGHVTGLGHDYVISWSSTNSVSSGITHEGGAQKWDLGARREVS